MPSLTDVYTAAVQKHLAGHDDDALRLCEEILAAAPSFAEAWNLRGVIAMRASQFNDATAYLARAVQLSPNFADPHNNLGLVALHGERNFAKAIACFQRALELKPIIAVALSNLGTAFTLAGDNDSAIDCYTRAIRLHPGYAEAHLNLGKSLFDLGRLDDAATCYVRALELDPTFAEAHYNLGCISRARGQFGEAKAAYLRALAINPAHAEANKNLAQIDLLTGDLERGWQGFEWRWKTGELPWRELRQPRWSGEPLTGKTVLLWAEQGLGDTFQFVRYAPLVKDLGATVIFECQKGLDKILAGCLGIDRLIAADEGLPPFDYHVSLLSLPGIFQTKLETIPAEVPYIFANSALESEWRQRLASVKGFRIGINWRGRSEKGPWQQRDLPLEMLSSLARIHGINLVSLQKLAAKTESGELFGAASILDVGQFDTAHGAFMDTAAIMTNLDLVISSDTSIAHLAGALGVPVWVALPFVPDWRWLLNRSDSPWYPTMRLFRQKQPGDWAGVFEEISTALKERMAQR